VDVSHSIADLIFFAADCSSATKFSSPAWSVEAKVIEALLVFSRAFTKASRFVASILLEHLRQSTYHALSPANRRTYKLGLNFLRASPKAAFLAWFISPNDSNG